MELCIGLAVALAVFVLVGLFVVKILQRKGRDDSLASDYQPEYFPERDKKNLFMSPSCHRHHPELAQSVSLPPCYEYPYSDPIHSKLELRRSCSEHHYDVPHFSNSHCHALTSPSVSSHSVDSSICPASATPPVDIKSVKNHHSDSNQSISSFFSSSSSADSICDVTSGLTTSTDLMDSVSLTTAYVMTCGGRLSLPESSVSLTIPEGAVAKGTRHKVLIAVLREDRHRPKLPERQTQLSPVVMSGPLGLTFKKPVILNFQHCASLKHSPWNVSVWCSSSQLDESPVWQKVVVLGEETINTPMFTQLDHNQVYLITDQLMRFVIVGESDKNLNKAVKILCLAVFAPAPEFHPQMLDYNVRVYTLEDTVAALEGVKVMESKLGGCLLDKPKTMLFQDGGANLCLSIEDICPGWRCKPQADYQEIPFQHVWNSTHNHLHCSFTLQRTDRLQDTGAFRILVCQKGIQTNRQLFCINTEIHSTTSITSLVPRSPVPSQTPTVTTSSGCSSMNTTLENASSPFRIPQVVKSQVCQYLDPPNARGNDWRMLAQRLKVDRYLASGCSFKDIHYSYRIGRSSASKIVRTMCRNIWEVMKEKCILTPNENNWKNVAGGFQDRANFPNF